MLLIISQNLDATVLSPVHRKQPWRRVDFTDASDLIDIEDDIGDEGSGTDAQVGVPSPFGLGEGRSPADIQQEIVKLDQRIAILTEQRKRLRTYLDGLSH